VKKKKTSVQARDSGEPGGRGEEGRRGQGKKKNAAIRQKEGGGGQKKRNSYLGANTKRHKKREGVGT